MDADSKIFRKFQNHIDQINLELYRVLDSKEPLAREMGCYALLGGGKRLRPLLFVLCAELCGYRGEDLYRLSTIFEYVHAASLLHDDVLDNAEVRRRRPSLNNLRGNHAAVIAGDFLYCAASSISLTAENMAFFRILAETTTRMTEGQILELMNTGNLSLSSEDYFKIITFKTAELISAACASPALLVGAAADTTKALAEFGTNMGIAFQLIDDLLDYTSSEGVFGKPVGKDLKEGKVTLPLLYTLKESKDADRDRIVNLIGDEMAGQRDYDYVIEMVRRDGSLDRVYSEAGDYTRRAAQCLGIFRPCASRDSLLELNDYILKRSW